MSLRSLLQSRADLRQAFGVRLKRPQARLERGLRAPPLTANHDMIAGAFDYLLGFHLQRLNPQTRSGPWLAEQGVEAIRLQSAGGADVPTLSGHPRALKASAYLADAKRQYRAYMQVGRITDNLLTATHRLAHLDAAARFGAERVDWHTINYLSADDAADLRAMLALAGDETFRTSRASVLKPRFAAAGLAGGAAADMVLGDCLLDVRTTKESRIDVRDFYHLLGCWLLLGLGGVERAEGAIEQLPVTAVGIYLARFGQLWRVPVEQVLPATAVPDFTRWFVDVLVAANAGARGQLDSLDGPLAAHLA
ncbi:MAG: hypothetical protein IT529_04730 [Burkholderiales bacterium]|nr:hypothetical protein [Burkholderiales bacterium]